MNYHLITWTANLEKAAEQTAFAQKLAARTNELYPEANVKILQNVTLGHQAGWIDTFPSLAAWEEANNALSQDEQWQAIWSEGQKNGLVAETTHSFYRVTG